MAEKNIPGGYPGAHPDTSPPPYSVEPPPPGYPIGIVVPGMAPGGAQPQPSTVPQQAPIQQQFSHGTQAQYGQSPTVIIYSNTPAQFGPYPQRYSCPQCRAHVMTETRTKPGVLTYILSGTLLVLGWYLLCCFVPFCVRECQDIQHVCPNCKSKLGLYKRI